MAIRFPLRYTAIAKGAELGVENEDFVLRLMRRGDYMSWRRVREDNYENLQPYEPTWAEDALSRNYFVKQVRQSDIEAGMQNGGRFLLICRETGDVMGGLNYSNVRRGVAQMVNIGYWIGKEYGGLGRMKSAVRCAVDHAFNTLGFHRVEAACVPENKASAAILLSAGFEEEGFAKAYLRINGDWRDHRQFAIVRPNG